MAPIAVGDKLPEGTLAYFDEDDELQQVSIHSLAAGKKVVVIGVPGAFTPTCRSKSYLIFLFASGIHP
uniref:glutaredoxin-dependent peroxiredoxin n=1 Tax=Rhizophora mucronata TaxID=61149 RepID=A0A2P2JKX4_RHIMU